MTAPTCHWCGFRDAALQTDDNGTMRPTCLTCYVPVDDPDPIDEREGATVAKILRAIDSGASTRDEIAEALGVDLTCRPVQLSFNRLLHWLRTSDQVTAIPIDPKRKRPEYRYEPGVRHRRTA